MPQRVTIEIAGVPYTLSVNTEKEELVLRKAALNINKTFKDIRSSYQIADKQEAFALTTLQIASMLEDLLLETEKEKEYISSKLDLITNKIKLEK